MPKPWKTKEERSAEMEQITNQLKEGVKQFFTSETYMDYLKTMSKFHNYSFNNVLLIALQKPEASLVAGYAAYQIKGTNLTIDESGNLAIIYTITVFFVE